MYTDYQLASTLEAQGHEREGERLWVSSAWLVGLGSSGFACSKWGSPHRIPSPLKKEVASKAYIFKMEPEITRSRPAKDKKSSSKGSSRNPNL